MAAYITPAVTPLLPGGGIDEASCRRLYEHLIKGGVDGILILGSIGEFFAFPMEERKRLIRIAAEAVAGRTELIVGTTSMVFQEIVELSNEAYQLGADSVMIIPPYYFHFNDAEVEAYYDALAKALKGHFYLYNFPDRMGYGISPDVVCRLAQRHPHLIGIKDTLAGVDHTREIIKLVKAVRPDFRVYSGFDDNFLHNVLCGGDGCIAGLSNLYPHLTSAWVRAVSSRDMEQAMQIQQRIDQLMDIYGVGKPFVPFIKQALYMKGIIDHPCATFPMPVPTDAQVERIAAIMRREEQQPV